MLAYHPVGLKELGLIVRANFEAFPPRFPVQPIFDVVLNLEDAKKIASNCSKQSPSSAFFVTKFEVQENYVKKFTVQTVGSRNYQELSIPAEDFAEFNRHIIGKIQIVAAYCGEDFRDEIDPKTNLPKSLKIPPF